MTQFKDFELDPSILSSLEKLGYISPTPIQQLAIPYLLENEGDLVALAATGTGKTASFGLPLLHQLDRSSNSPQALILAPTRELSSQVVSELNKFSSNLKGVRITEVIGGASIEKQIDSLKRGSQIIVATPGRLVDLLKRKKIDMSGIRSVVLDEADEMLNMGFQNDLNEIMKALPSEKRLILFSATMSRQVRRIASDYMTDPYEIGNSEEHKSSGGIRHIYYRVKAHNKYAALKRILDTNPEIYAIVFCRTKSETGEISGKLIQDGYGADSLHGDLSHSQREQVMKRFHSRNIQILVATDVAARGLHVTDLSHVIHFSMPLEPELYTHRSGRTGRAGKFGLSVSLINLREENKLLQYGKQIGIEFHRETIPAGSEIFKNHINTYLNRVLQTDVNNQISENISEEMMLVYDQFTKEEFLHRVLSEKFSALLRQNDVDSDLDITDEKDTSGTHAHAKGQGSRSRKKDSRRTPGQSKKQKNSYGFPPRGGNRKKTKKKTKSGVA